MTDKTGPPSTSSRSSIFLTCFGYSGEKMQVLDKVNSTSRRRRWLSEWSLSCKKSEVKSVHVDFKPTHRKSKSLNETKHVLLTSEEPKIIKHVPTTSEEQKVLKHVPTTSEEQKTCRKSWINVVKGQKSESGSFRSRRKDTKPGATSAKPDATSAKPGATSAKPVGGLEPPETKVVTVTTMKALTQSKSVPVVKQRQKPAKHVEHRDKTTSSSGELDSIMGMLILLVIMIIMMLWGKVCAIFCTCAWFFIAPRVMAAAGGGYTMAEKSPELVDNININNININMESVEYKKKVVLEGLLQRNHRNNVVGRL